MVLEDDRLVLFNNMEIKDGLSAAVLQVLDKDNYVAWSTMAKTYLMAQDLWKVVEAITEPPKQEDDEDAFKAWSNKNSMALHVLKDSCGPNALSVIRRISSAKIAWNTLAVVFQVLKKDNYMDWSVRVKTYLMAHDLWEIIEATTEPPKEEDDEVAFMAWSKKNSTALHVIQISCGLDTFFEIIETSSAKIAWDTLAEKYNVPTGTSSSGSDQNGNVDQYKALKEAVQSGDWNTAKDFLTHHPGAAGAKITILDHTALHVAVKAGHEHIVEKLVDEMSEEDLAIRNCFGNTALVSAINAGNIKLAACMVQKNNNLLSIKGSRNIIPVNRAIFNGHIKLARYLYSLTPLEDLMPEKGIEGAILCTRAIYNRSLDIALHLIQRCPRLALALDNDRSSPLYALASMPNAFWSGDQLLFWKRWIYDYCIHSQVDHATEEIRLNIQNVKKSRSDQVKIIESVLAPLRQLVPNLLNILGIKDLYEMKLVHVQYHKLMDCMCKEVSISNVEQRGKGQVYKAILCSIVKGNFEFIFGIVRANPDLVWTRDDDSMSIFAYAVLHRQEKIFSLIYRLDVKKTMTNWVDKNGNCILHMAGMLATSTKLNRIQGAALQMQRELQWFKEVESIVAPRFKEFSNKEGLTPRELFTKNHKDLRKEGETWMKDTATSCTVVGALIVTIMFAAAFTVPGGNKQDGYPIFLDEKLFMLFIISDALSLFSSSTSVLMFLGILTSRYAEDDFLESLPRKMIIGLSTLFFSIAAMMIAFSAALLIMLQGQSWIVIPIVCLASVPITLFVLMQFPLLVDMFISTYGQGIFDKKMERWV